MLKKILIAAILVAVGLWAAGYRLGDIKDGIVGAADSNASEMTGGSSDWGD